MGIDFQNPVLPELTSTLTYKKQYTAFWERKPEELYISSIQLEHIQAVLRLLLTRVR